MIRVLLDAPISYSLNKLRAEIMARYPQTLDINEVDTDKRYVAVYLSQGVEYEISDIQEIVMRHEPSQDEVSTVTVEQRLDEIEEALALLHMEVSRR